MNLLTPFFNDIQYKKRMVNNNEEKKICRSKNVILYKYLLNILEHFKYLNI